MGGMQELQLLLVQQALPEEQSWWQPLALKLDSSCHSLELWEFIGGIWVLIKLYNHNEQMYPIFLSIT